MSEKVLTSLGCKPTLVNMYESHTKKIYHDWVHVPRQLWPRFKVLQEELQDANVSSLEYTQVLLTSMKDWVRELHLLSVPPHVFVSDFAIEKFMRIHSKKTITILDDDEDVGDLNDELTLLRYYIHKYVDDNKFTLKQAVDDLEPMISKKVVELYRRDSNPHMDAIMTLADEVGAKVVSLQGILQAVHGHGR